MQPKPEWHEKALRRKKIITSASQYETAESCLRKWWFAKVRRLPEPHRKAQILGSVIHSVAERFFLADEYGRDPETGNPVELFPEGWNIVRDRFDPSKIEGEVSESERPRIEQMVQRAVEEGVWVRRPGRKVEHSFRKKIANFDGVDVELMGLVDVLNPDMIEDHKTTKNRKWAKGAKALAEQQPMLTYAKMTLGDETRDSAKLRYNYFSKDESEATPWAVETEVPWSRVEQNYQRILKLSEEMVSVLREDDWEKVPGPRCATACSDFGGCPFARICTNRQTPEAFEEAASVFVPKVSQQNPERIEKMNLQELMKKRKATLKKPEADEDPTPAEDSTPAEDPTPPEVEEKPEQGTPEWADPNCKACGGSGYNSKGNPCSICQIRYRSKQPKPEPKPEPQSWVLLWDQDRQELWWTSDEAEATAAVESGAEMLRSEESVDRPAIPSKKDLGLEKVEDKPEREVAKRPPEKSAKSKQDDDQEDKPDRRGRPRGRRPTLYVNCAPIGRKVSTEAQAMHKCIQALQAADEAEVSEDYSEALAWFLSKDPFKRRDALPLVVQDAVNYMDTHIVFLAKTLDFKALLDAMTPYCNRVDGLA